AAAASAGREECAPGTEAEGGEQGAPRGAGGKRHDNHSHQRQGVAQVDGGLARPWVGTVTARWRLCWSGSDPPVTRRLPVAKARARLLANVTALGMTRGLVFPSGEIYGGTRAAWDYGPLGVEVKENIKKQWWRTFVQSRGDMVGLDASIILPKRVWEASGHV